LRLLQIANGLLAVPVHVPKSAVTERPLQFPLGLLLQSGLFPIQTGVGRASLIRQPNRRKHRHNPYESHARALLFAL
jgi:hypothetical protein